MTWTVRFTANPGFVSNWSNRPTIRSIITLAVGPKLRGSALSGYLGTFPRIIPELIPFWILYCIQQFGSPQLKTKTALTELKLNTYICPGSMQEAGNLQYDRTCCSNCVGTHQVLRAHDWVQAWVTGKRLNCWIKKKKKGK